MKKVTTEIDTHIGQPVLGYVPLAFLSEENQQQISLFQEKLKKKFPDVIWNTPPTMLHITLMDWLAPLVAYEKDKDNLFKDIFPQYDSIFQQIFKTLSTITVSFDTLHVYPGAIILSGTDNGKIQSIRNTFLEKINLLPGTKQPPKIVHTSLARFIKEVDIKEIETFVNSQSMMLSQTIEEFYLIRVSTMYEIYKDNFVKKYQLGG